MTIQNDGFKDATVLTELLKNIKLPKEIVIGDLVLQVKRGVIGVIQYNREDCNLLANEQDYTFSISDGDLQVSLQLYETIQGYHRLFCYTKIKGIQGMTFSLNLVTEKSNENLIYLKQKIKFTERSEGTILLSKENRKQKKISLCELLKKYGFEIIDDDVVSLGVFDPKKKKLIDTSPDKFLTDFVIVSILKGHFQGNKGYQLDIV